MERRNITKTYTNKGLCNYCPCRRKLQSSTTVIKHLQVLETRFFCYLILDDEKYHDEKNQQRIDAYLTAIRTDQINEPTLTRRSRFTVGSNKGCSAWFGHGGEPDGLEFENSRGAICFGPNNDQDDGPEEEQNMVSILSDFRESYARRFERMNAFVEQLKSKANSAGLEQGIIDAQEQLKLVKRNEDFLNNEKDFSFLKQIRLSYDDLDFLMNKYGISDEFEIAGASVILNMQIKYCGDRSRTNTPNHQPIPQQAASRPQVAKRSVPFDKNQFKAKDRSGQENSEDSMMKYARSSDEHPKSMQLVPVGSYDDDETRMDTGEFTTHRPIRPRGYDASSIPFRVKIENCIDEEYENSQGAKRTRHG